MFCTRCGQQILEGQRFCPYCGTEVVNYSQESVSSNQGIYAPEGTTVLPHYQQMYNVVDNATVYEEAPAYPPMPMKWYKFLIYFALFAGALLNLSGAGSSFKTAESWFIPSELKAIYRIYGVVLIGFAVIGIVARQKLAKYKANGPAFLIGLYAGNLAVSVLYSIVVGAIAGVGVFNASLLINILTQALMIWANKVYFKKRDHLFVNY